MSNKISVIVFDLGNVLLPFDYNIVIEKLENIETGLGVKLMKNYRENYHLHRAHEKSEITSEDFVNTMLGWIDNAIPRDEFVSIYTDVFTENKKLTSLIPSLKQKYKLVMLSNTNPIHMKRWIKYDFVKYFDKMILSHEVKSFKPEPEIYKAVEDFTKADPGEHLFIDDIEEYVNAAQKRGWNGIIMQDSEQVTEELKSYGIM